MRVSFIERWLTWAVAGLVGEAADLDVGLFYDPKIGE